MSIPRLAGVALLVVQAFVAVTAFLGGLALTLGALVPSMATAFSPPEDYLAGTPFISYLLPGLLLGIVVAGTHTLAFVLVLHQHPWAVLASAVAAFAVLIWIFIQMIFIPFSFLQAVYFVSGVAEAGFVMVRLGLFTRIPRAA
jgi:hypothetical protein